MFKSYIFMQFESIHCVFIFNIVMYISKCTDLQCVFNSIWEVLQGTDGDGFLRWVLAGAV